MSKRHCTRYSYGPKSTGGGTEIKGPPGVVTWDGLLATSIPDNGIPGEVLYTDGASGFAWAGLPAAPTAEYVTFWQALNENVDETVITFVDTFELFDDTPVYTAAPTTSFNPLAGSTSRLEYKGAGGNFLINWSASVQLKNGDKEGEFQLFLNGVAIPGTAVDHHLNKDKTSTAAGNFDVVLATNDVLDVRIKNKENTENMYIRTFVLNASQIL